MFFVECHRRKRHEGSFCSSGEAPQSIVIRGRHRDASCVVMLSNNTSVPSPAAAPRARSAGRRPPAARHPRHNVKEHSLSVRALAQHLRHHPALHELAARRHAPRCNNTAPSAAPTTLSAVSSHIRKNPRKFPTM